jgi:hypothetical protein
MANKQELIHFLDQHVLILFFMHPLIATAKPISPN